MLVEVNNCRVETLCGPVWSPLLTMVSWLVCLSPDRAVWVQAPSGDIALFSWARHFTLTVPLSAQVNKRVIASSYRNRDMFRLDEPLGSYVDFTFTFNLYI